MTQSLPVQVQDLMDALAAAYTALLAPDGQFPRHTAEGQALLCQCRDALAAATGCDPQAIQELHEYNAQAQYVSGVMTRTTAKHILGAGNGRCLR